MKSLIAITSTLGVLIAAAMVSTMGLAGLAFPPGPRVTQAQLPDRATIKTALVAGGDETGAGVSIAVAAMLGTDRLIACIVLTTAAAIATAAQRAVTDFRCRDGSLLVIANAADNTNNQYLIIYQSVN